MSRVSFALRSSAKGSVSLALVFALAVPWNVAAQRRGSSDWSDTGDLKRGTRLRILLKDGGAMNAHLVRVDAEGLSVADFSRVELSKGEQSRAAKLIGNGETRVVRLGKRDVDLSRIARQIPRNDVRELYTIRKGRGALRAAIFAGIAFFIAIPIVVSIGFSDCGGDCTDEGIAMLATAIGLPLAGGLLGYYSARERVVLVYRARQ